MKKLFLILLLFILPSEAWSACTGSSPTWNCTTESCPTQTEVTACIAQAGFLTGDTLNLAAGSYTWTNHATIPSAKKINIVGAGGEATVISISAVGEYAFEMNESGSRITAIGFYTETAGTGFILVNGTGWRIDNCRFNNNTGDSNVAITATGAGTTTSPTGLIDNNAFLNGRILVYGFQDSHSAAPVYPGPLQNALWAEPITFGDSDAVYIENNTFTRPDMTNNNNAVDGDGGTKIVVRYNTLNGTYLMTHSVQSATGRGAKKWEIYGNIIDKSPVAVLTTPIWMRAGTGFIFNNSFVGSYSNNGVAFDNVRSIPGGYSTSDNTTIAGRCDGDNAYDGNTSGQSGWPCLDQIGRGYDASLLTVGETPYPAQVSIPAYVWSNIRLGAQTSVIIRNSCSTWIQANRDYYVYASAFNGTSGVGCGTLANRPGTCTTGVGYWATDQSCSDITDYVGASPTTPIAGTLYKCTATNTWTAYYTPYTYPHPLRGESDTTAPTATWAIDSTGLIATATFSEAVNATTKTGVSFTGTVTGAITATYKDGMPGGIVRYDLNKTVQQEETVVVDYTTPGDGIKDLASNALADISDGAVSNGSTVATPPLVALTIGSHTGATVNVYPGINCGATCGPVEYDTGTVLTVSVTALPNYTGCTIGGTGCGASTTMSEARSCTVTCTKINANAKIGAGNPGHRVGAGNPGHRIN